jgi:HK97 family phage major capsid protein
MKPALREKLDAFKTKQTELANIMELAKDGDRFDLSRPKVLEGLGAADRADALDKVKARNRELDDLGSELEQAELREVKDSAREREDARNAPTRGGTALVSVTDERETLGTRWTKSAAYQAYKKNGSFGITASVDMGLKTLFQTSAGFPPESIRSGLIVPKADLSLAEILDLVPAFPLAQPAFVYMEETVRVHAAAETAEGQTYPESTFEYAQKNSPAQKIGDSLPVTDEQLEDEGTMASLLDQRLRYGVRKRLASQIMAGNGVGTNLRGVLNTGGIQTQAKGGDSTMAAAFKALTKVRFTGDAEPSAFVFHPNDWQDVILAQETTGAFIWGHPAFAPLTRLWGLAVAVSTGITENTGLVGDFPNFSRLDEKRGIEVQIGFVADQFKQGQKTIRADVRTAFTVLRPAAFCTITGI